MKVSFFETVRYSAAGSNPKARAAPAGMIDPWLKVVSFWDGDRPLAALHYYATHPMSYYGDGRVTSDFCGLARDRLAAFGPRTLLLRGDRSPPAMIELVDALHAAMPGSSRQVVAGANHLLPVTHAAQVTQAVLLHLHAGAERRQR